MADVPRPVFSNRWLICDNQLKKNFTLLSLYVSFCAMLSYLALCNAGRFRLVVIDAYGAPCATLLPTCSSQTCVCPVSRCHETEPAPIRACSTQVPVLPLHPVVRCPCASRFDSELLAGLTHHPVFFACRYYSAAARRRCMQTCLIAGCSQHLQCSLK